MRLLLHLTLLVSASVASAADITLKWNVSPPEVTGYKVYYGTAPGISNGSVDVGNATTKTFEALTDGKTYYFAVSAYDKNLFESKLSSELAAVASASDSTFTIAVAPAVNPGTSVKNVNSYVVTITRNGYTAPINFNVSGLPDGSLPPKFSTNPAQTKSTLTVTTTACTPPATYTFTVVGFGCSPPLTRTATGTLQIK